MVDSMVGEKVVEMDCLRVVTMVVRLTLLMDSMKGTLLVHKMESKMELRMDQQLDSWTELVLVQLLPLAVLMSFQSSVTALLGSSAKTKWGLITPIFKL
jgi:hypothetical protein